MQLADVADQQKKNRSKFRTGGASGGLGRKSTPANGFSSVYLVQITDANLMSESTWYMN